MGKRSRKTVANNKKAFHDYTIEERFEAGIVLTGTEIKSVRRGSVSIGLGIAVLMYFMNLIANITESAKDLKYLTPFGFCDGALIAAEGKLDGAVLAAGMALGALGILAAYLKYPKKDIA